jgi:hypothetical protein
MVNNKFLYIAGELKPLSATGAVPPRVVNDVGRRFCVRHQFILLIFKLKITNKKP